MYEPPVPGPGAPRPSRRSPEELSGLLIVALPVILGIFMVIVTPRYFQPMVRSPLGWWMLALAVALEAAAFGAVSWGNRRFRGSPMQHKLFMMPVMLLLVFPTLWLVLLGPALLIVMRAKGAG